MSLMYFFAPITGLILAVGSFIMFDTITGVWKTIKNHGVKGLRSKRLAHIIPKMIIYNLAVLTFFTLDKHITNAVIMNLFSIEFLLTKIVAIVLISIETKSIDENWQEIYGVGLFKSLKKLLVNLREVKSDTDKILKKDNNE